MQIDSEIIFNMFAVLRVVLVTPGGLAKIIRFTDINNITLCDIPFNDIVVDPNVPSEFYFQDQFGSRIIRNIVTTSGTAAYFKIYDNTSTVKVSGTVSTINAGGDITFNALSWTEGQVLIISSLKIIFPTES